MNSGSTISQFGLYGEREGAHEPEFVHIEAISQRSRLFDWTISPHVHPGIYQILLLEAGSGVLATDGEDSSLEPGALIVLPNGCVHAFRFAPDAEGWVLSLATDLLNDARIVPFSATARRPDVKPRWVQLDCGSSAARRIAWLLADLAEVLSNDRAGLLPDAVAARLALVMTLVEESLAVTADRTALQQGGSPRERLAARFRELVELHFRDGWRVSDYASALGTTIPTLTRSSRAALGRSPGEVVLDRVLLEAMRSLTYSAASISQIATDLGFADSAYFARFFKARCGLTAGVFRGQRSWLANAPALPARSVPI